MTIVDDLLSNRWSGEGAIGTAIPFEMRPQRGVQTRITPSNERLLATFLARQTSEIEPKLRNLQPAVSAEFDIVLRGRRQISNKNRNPKNCKGRVIQFATLRTASTTLLLLLNFKRP
jgi:hypothetical protein